VSAARWDLGKLPLQIGHRASPRNHPLPDYLPFSVGVDEQSGLIVQCENQEVSRALAEAYRLGSQMGTPLSSVGVGSAQLAEVRTFIHEASPHGDVHGLAVLEIGCGDGALLEQLAHQGAVVAGVEPGEAAAIVARARRLEIHREPFQAARFAGRRFDLIVHHTVLEHIERPIRFIADQLELLTADGRIICCVPDCAHAIERGDLSMLVHEHWSYFDSQTLMGIGAAAGARTVTWRNADTEGVIYCSWARDPTVKKSPPAPPPYVERGKRALRAMSEYARQLVAAGASLGVYCAARFVNYHALLAGGLAAIPEVRWFDDDPALHGRFYPPIPIAIESRDELLARPVDELLIASWTFADALRESLAGQPALAGTRIRTLADVL
jgi:2-polyprenyl-3-methyl-5-hydroxy-6-metoxy-1,4-benzoquinol methylase